MLDKLLKIGLPLVLGSTSGGQGLNALGSLFGAGGGQQGIGTLGSVLGSLFQQRKPENPLRNQIVENVITSPQRKAGPKGYSFKGGKQIQASEPVAGASPVEAKTMTGSLLQNLGMGDNTLFTVLNSPLGEGLAAGLLAQLLASGDEEEDTRSAYEKRPFGFGGPGGQIGGINYANQGGVMDFPRRDGGIDPSEGSGTKDDVPAMLTAGEFVLTKDAVKGLGNGNQRLGIQKAYDMMNNLERMA